MLDMMLTRLNKGARIVLCGIILVSLLSTFHSSVVPRCNFSVSCVVLHYFLPGPDIPPLVAVKPTCLKNYLVLISQRAKIQGFIVYV